MAGHITKWTQEMIAELRKHARERKIFMKEAAEQMGVPVSALQHKARRLGISWRVRERYGEWNIKHQHLQEDVLRYFKNHTMEQTRKHFKLTAGELKSCIGRAYQNPELKHLRKDGRCHERWELDKVVFALRHVGIQPGVWIAKKLGRGETRHPVKELLQEHCAGAQSRYLNGKPIAMATILFGDQVRPRLIKTKAGPRGNTRKDGSVPRRCDFAYKILPWIEAEDLLDRGLTRPLIGKGKCTPARLARAPRLKVSREVETMIRSMAQFQRWLHGVSSTRQIRSRFGRALKRR